MKRISRLAELGWVLDEHILSVPHTLHALLLSADGLAVTLSGDLDRAVADRMAATVSGMQSLSQAATEFADGEDDVWELTMMKYRGSFIFVCAVDPVTYLAVSAAKDVDVETVGFAMEKMTDRLGHELAIPARSAGGASS